MKSSTIHDCKLIKLPKIHAESGDITSITGDKEVPFTINRVYYLYDVPNNADRGAHAHKELYQLIVAVTGSFEMSLFDGRLSKQVILNQPDIGLLIVPGIWRDLNMFSGGSICLVLVSHLYSELDYIRNIKEYNEWKFKY
jgi:hypothetical protein